MISYLIVYNNKPIFQVITNNDDDCIFILKKNGFSVEFEIKCAYREQKLYVIYSPYKYKFHENDIEAELIEKYSDIFSYIHFNNTPKQWHSFLNGCYFVYTYSNQFENIVKYLQVNNITSISDLENKLDKFNQKIYKLANLDPTIDLIDYRSKHYRHLNRW